MPQYLKLHQKQEEDCILSSTQSLVFNIIFLSEQPRPVICWVVQSKDEIQYHSRIYEIVTQSCYFIAVPTAMEMNKTSEKQVNSEKVLRIILLTKKKQQFWFLFRKVSDTIQAHAALSLVLWVMVLIELSYRSHKIKCKQFSISCKSYAEIEKSD